MKDLLDISTIKNQWTYEPPEGYTEIYRHKCYFEDLTFSSYVGSTNDSMKKRAGKHFKNYHGTAVNKGETKFEEYLNEYGCRNIKSELLYVVRDELRAEYEQKAIDEYDAINMGFNSIKAIVERKTTNTRKFVNRANEKNNPTIIGEEDVSLTFKHRDGSVDIAVMNAGLYYSKYRDTVLHLGHPGADGAVQLRDPMRMHTTPLQDLARDLGVALKFGPAGVHTITLDNIYIVGTRTSLRIYLEQHPELSSRVAYLKFGVWEEE